MEKTSNFKSMRVNGDIVDEADIMMKENKDFPFQNKGLFLDVAVKFLMKKYLDAKKTSHHGHINDEVISIVKKLNSDGRLSDKTYGLRFEL